MVAVSESEGDIADHPEVRRPMLWLWADLWDPADACDLVTRTVECAQLEPYLPVGWETECEYSPAAT